MTITPSLSSRPSSTSEGEGCSDGEKPKLAGRRVHRKQSTKADRRQHGSLRWNRPGRCVPGPATVDDVGRERAGYHRPHSSETCRCSFRCTFRNAGIEPGSYWRSNRSPSAIWSHEEPSGRVAAGARNGSEQQRNPRFSRGRLRGRFRASTLTWSWSTSDVRRYTPTRQHAKGMANAAHGLVGAAAAIGPASGFSVSSRDSPSGSASFNGATFGDFDSRADRELSARQSAKGVRAAPANEERESRRVAAFRSSRECGPRDGDERLASVSPRRSVQPNDF